MSPVIVLAYIIKRNSIYNLHLEINVKRHPSMQPKQINMCIYILLYFFIFITIIIIFILFYCFTNNVYNKILIDFLQLIIAQSNLFIIYSRNIVLKKDIRI